MLMHSLEWTFFAIIAAPPPSPSLSALPQTVFLPIPALAMIRAQAAGFPLITQLLSWIPDAAWPSVLIAPPYLFALNAAANMTPRAIRGLAWYRQTFGERFPEGRKAIVPFLL
jgi:3-oxo-5-alpha-steroid 4-dehydrogenase 1